MGPRGKKRKDHGPFPYPPCGAFSHSKRRRFRYRPAPRLGPPPSRRHAGTKKRLVSRPPRKTFVNPRLRAWHRRRYHTVPLRVRISANAGFGPLIPIRPGRRRKGSSPWCLQRECANPSGVFAPREDGGRSRPFSHHQSGACRNPRRRKPCRRCFTIQCAARRWCAARGSASRDSRRARPSDIPGHSRDAHPGPNFP